MVTSLPSSFEETQGSSPGGKRSKRRGKPKISPREARYRAITRQILEKNPGLPLETTRLHDDSTRVMPELPSSDLETWITQIHGKIGTALVSSQPSAEKSEAPYYIAEQHLPDQSALHRYVEDVSAAPPEDEPSLEIEVGDYGDFSVDDLVELDKLDELGAEELFFAIKQNLADERLWQFLEHKAPSREDLEVFRQNLNRLSPEFVHAVLIIGAFREKFYDHALGVERTIFVYNGAKLDKGQMGMVSHVLYAYNDQPVLMDGLIKCSFDTEAARISFQHEKEIAQRVKHIIENNLDDHRIRNVLYPIHIGQAFFIMPRVRDRQDQSKNLNDIIKEIKKTAPSDGAKKLAEVLSGAVHGLNLLAENGLINTDLKPANVLSSPYGGVIIDWGGIMTRESINIGPLFYSPSFFNVAIATAESSDALPSGASHKHSLCRIIEKYFFHRRIVNTGDPSVYGELLAEPIQQLEIPPVTLQEDQINAAEFLLYQLYLKLHKSHLHPFRFLGNDPQNGLDPEYISSGEIIALLEEISKINV